MRTPAVDQAYYLAVYIECLNSFSQSSSLNGYCHYKFGYSHTGVLILVHTPNVYCICTSSILGQFNFHIKGMGYTCTLLVSIVN